MTEEQPFFGGNFRAELEACLPAAASNHPLPPIEAKEWHSLITSDLRQHLIGKLIKALFPSPNPSAIHDGRVRDLLSYAREVEGDFFSEANNKEQYYRLMAEKIFMLQKELQAQKARRMAGQSGGR